MKSAASITRRSVLGLAALALAACKKGSSPSASRIDPDAAALAAARAVEAELIAALDGDVQPGMGGDLPARVAAERALHARHLAALGGTAAVSHSVSRPPTAPPPPAHRSLLRRSAASLREAAVRAANGSHAAVFASIAASHEVMLHD